MEKEELERCYRKKYPNGKRGFVDLAIFNIIFEKFDRNILDVGCGFGEMLSALHAFNFNCKGMVLTNYEALACKESGLDVKEADASKRFPYNSESFGGVILLDSLEHFRDHKNALNESYRVLKKNGKILVYTLNRDIFRKTPKGINKKTSWGLVHYKEFTINEVREELQKAKFRNIEFLTKKLYYPKYYPLRFLDRILPKSRLHYICAVAQK